MPKDRIQFHQSTTGTGGEDEDWWNAVIDQQSGSVNVEHEWSYVSRYTIGTPDVGTRLMTAEEFFASDIQDQVKQKLRELLTARGLAF